MLTFKKAVNLYITVLNICQEGRTYFKGFNPTYKKE